MKYLFTLAALAASTQSFAANPGHPLEERIFSTLKEAGVFVEHSSNSAQRIGKIELKEISCGRQRRQIDTTTCAYVDAARPKERAALGAQAAMEMFDAIVASGQEPLDLFGESRVFLKQLSCEKIEAVRGESVEVHCQALRPLFP